MRWELSKRLTRVIFDPELVSAETQRRVFLGIVDAIVAMARSAPSEGSGQPLELGATIDGLLEVIATLLVNAQILPDGVADVQVCEDIRAALAAHIRHCRLELDTVDVPVRH